MEMIKASDGKALYLRKWLPEDSPLAAVVLLHGMCEHGGRYEEFAQYLNASGIALYCHDQRGHGLTGQAAGELGHLPPNWGWHMMVDDGCRIINLAKEELHCPIFLMGHSMGSFLARVLAQQNPDLPDGLILSGTGSNAAALVKAGRALAKNACRLQGAAKPSPFLQSLTFSAFNGRIKNHKTAFDWISSDEDMVQSYMDDAFCGQICTNGFFYELYDVNYTANLLENDHRLRRDMPVLIFSGDQDPVGDMGAGVGKVYRSYLDCGLQDVTCKLYVGGRHEMLNECSRREVYADVCGWLRKHCGQ